MFALYYSNWQLQPLSDTKNLNLSLFLPMCFFDPPENIKKPKVFYYFQGDQKGPLGNKG